MAYRWQILRSAVEQEILFPTEECYLSYLRTLDAKREPYKVVSESKKDDGSMVVIMRKRYNNTIFME